MRPFSTFGSRHPLATAVLILSLAVGWFVVPLVLRGPVDVTGGTGIVDMTDLRPFIVTEGLLVVVLCFIVALLRWGRATGLRGPVDPAGMRLALWILTPPVSIVAVSWLGFLSLEGLTFGLFHGANAIVGQNMTVTAIQMAGATGLGLFFGAVAVQARSLWPAIALHALWDAFALSAPAAFALLPQSDTVAVPQPGLPALIMPAVLSLAAWIMYRRWCRRMKLAGSCQLRND
jgi:hypothetical protein